jgi:hypothetical protein
MTESLRLHIAFCLKHGKVLTLFPVSQICFVVICVVIYTPIIYYANSMEPMARVACVCLIAGVQIIIQLRLCGEYYSNSTIISFYRYRFTSADFVSLSILISAPNLFFSMIALFFLLLPTTGMIFTITATLVILAASELIMVVATIFQTRKISRKASHPDKQIKKALTDATFATHLFANRNRVALLYRDIKAMRRLALFCELPLSLVMSCLAFAAGIMVPAVFAFAAFFSYLFFLFQLLVSLVEVEFLPAARQDSLRYRITSKRVWQTKTSAVLACALPLLIIHSITLLTQTDDPLLFCLTDLIQLCLVLLSLYCCAWAFERCTRHYDRFYPIAELLLFVLAALVPLAVTLSLVHSLQKFRALKQGAKTDAKTDAKANGKNNGQKQVAETRGRQC